MFAEGFKLVLGAPIKWLFGARGGYLSDVKKATSTDNVFLKVANLIGVLYTTAMPKLDAIAKYTRISATVAAGYEPTAPIMDKYTMFQKVKGFLKSKKKGKGLGDISKTDTLLKMLGVTDDEIKEFKGAGGFKGVFDLAKDSTKEGIDEAKKHGEKGIGTAKKYGEKGKEFLDDEMFDLEFKRRALAKQMKHKTAKGMAGEMTEAGYIELKKMTTYLKVLGTYEKTI